MTITLRPYQLKAKQDIYDSWAAGNRNVCAVLPTGAGKSVIVSDIIYDGFILGLTQVVIAHRNELVVQMSCHLAARGVHHRVIGANKLVPKIIREHQELFSRSFYNPSAKTAVIGVDTLIAREKEFSRWAEQVDRWVIDEFHHTIGNEHTKPNKWGKAVMLFPNAHGLGPTATPIRADGQGLGRDYDGVADSIIFGPSMRWLIENKYLSDYEVVCPLSDLQADEKEVSANGDWSNQYLRKKAKSSHIVGDVVENYIKWAIGRKAICFATDVETAGEIAKRFCNFGIRAVSLSAKTNEIVRDKYIKEFSSGKTTVLVNVDLFDEGFDVPDCEVCIMARPTASLGKYRQQVGRALRYIEGKTALIIDHVSNIIRHKLPDADFPFTLARRDKRGKNTVDPEDVPLTRCLNPECVKPYPRIFRACPFCGMSKPLPEPRQRSIEMVEGDLMLLDREALERMRKATVLETPADVAARVAHVAGPIAAKGVANRQIEKITEHKSLRDAIAQWAGIQRSRGLDDVQIQRKFYHSVGFDVLSALDAGKTREQMKQLREQIEGWYA